MRSCWLKQVEQLDWYPNPILSSCAVYRNIDPRWRVATSLSVFSARVLFYLFSPGGCRHVMQCLQLYCYQSLWRKHLYKTTFYWWEELMRAQKLYVLTNYRISLLYLRIATVTHLYCSAGKAVFMESRVKGVVSISVGVFTLYIRKALMFSYRRQ